MLAGRHCPADGSTRHSGDRGGVVSDVIADTDAVLMTQSPRRPNLWTLLRADPTLASVRQSVTQSRHSSRSLITPL